MPTIVLSQPVIDGPLAPGEYLDRVLPNFGIRVDGHGRKMFFVRVRERGHRVRIKLGRPSAELTLKVARQLAAGKLAAHDEGKILRPPIALAELDPASLDPASITFAKLLEAFLADHRAAWSDSHRRNQEFFVR